MIPVSLADRYVKRQDRILITGVQALVRLMLVQAERDRSAGLRTGGFVSGYRGSPLGTLDSAFAAAADLTSARGIVVKPGVNEELAATAIAGSQQIAQTPGARVEGVFALWYGKGPGLDRAADAIRHGNMQGASPMGGVVLAVGDDHLAKSSTIVCYSDETVASLQVPLFYPADAAEIVRLGLHAFAMSRHTGSWAALKIITEVADATRAVDADELSIAPILPDRPVPAIGLHNRWPETPLEQEMRQQDHRLPAAQAYVRANCLDLALGKTPKSRLGLIAAGKSWLDLREALRLLELSEARLAELGVALYKPALIWPLEPESLGAFAQSLDTVMVIEEKAAFIEGQVKTILYGQAGSPAVWGKRGPDGKSLFPATGDLTPERIAAELAEILADRTDDEPLRSQGRIWRGALAEQSKLTIAPAARKPFFCSGCPHNRSTVVPEGSRAVAGIGCHGLAAYNRPGTSSFAQMGGEGVHWMGLAPFTDEPHIFANMGDGTYFHSGLLAVRQAVAARLNITYKLLYNSAVAMTGGQPLDGDLSVLQLVEQLRAEGVGRIVVSTDDPDRYGPDHPVRALVDRVEHRDGLDVLQRELREIPGVTVIVYDQMCATEKRRLRKRGKLADPTARVFINPLVCEGCGDCSATSNCLSVEPLETKYGLKRRINQFSCNKDYSCTNGFCPSFVTVEGAVLKKPATSSAETPVALPPPPELGSPHDHQRVVIAGIGGTGVVTIGALLSMTAHMMGRQAGVLDQVGMAQKGGAVVSHLHIATDPIDALRIPPGQADLVLVCDEIVGNARDVMSAIDPARTCVVTNSDVAITGDFTQNRDAVADARLLRQRLSSRTAAERFRAFPFTRLSEHILGDVIGANLMMMGLAYQLGWLQIDVAALEAATALNGVGAAMNREAFAWGRQLAIDPTVVYRAANLVAAADQTTTGMIAERADFLAAYQDRAYAGRFLSILAPLQAAEAAVSGDTRLLEAAARALFKLMAYKDEYEVARLYTDGAFAAALAEQFEPGARLSFHLAPPVFAPRDKLTGQLQKRRFGPWMMAGFRVLAALRRLRGTSLDPFGYMHERRSERALIVEFEQVLSQLSGGLTAERLPTAIEIATLPMEIRGYGHIKAKAIDLYHLRLADRLACYDAAEADTRSLAGHDKSQLA